MEQDSSASLSTGMDSAARIYDMYETMLENILQDPHEPPVPLPLEFLRAITDDFSPHNEIGRGAFGAVYKGILRSGKVIAVKKIFDTYPTDKEKSLDELNRVMGITHPNVVQLIGYCAETKMDTVKQDSGKLVAAELRSRLLCFEYLSNGGLDKYISKEHLDLSWDMIYDIIKGICSGLQSLHEENMVHLDLKPQNILMDSNMMPKIVDFGLARLLDDKKSKIYTQIATGTVGYIAPEYHFDGKISPKADIFSLGVIMIELITGSRNYPHRTPFYSYTSYENNRPDTTEAQLQQFTHNVLGTWRKIFAKTLNDASLTEVYTHQLKQMIDIALRCVDNDINKRPKASDILQFFSQDKGGGSSSDPSSKYSQVRDLISLDPIELKIPMADPNKLHRSSCLLHLNNNTVGYVAFRILSNTLLRYFIWPSFYFVPPGCRYTIAFTMRNKQNPPPSEDLFFTLECTRASGQEIRNVSLGRLTYSHEEFFTKAKDNGRHVQVEKITSVYVNSEPEIQIVPMEVSDYTVEFVDMHPAEPWILIVRWRKSILIWNYNTQEMASLPASREQRVVFNRNDNSIEPLAAKFISQKMWIVVGCTSGYIKVYSYCKQSLFSEIKSFKAHAYGDVWSIELHQTGPYVLSAVCSEQRAWSRWDNPMDKIKLWDWENDWKLVCTFNSDMYADQVKFNPKDVNTFAAISNGLIKVWNTGSTGSISGFPGIRNAWRFDFFSQDGMLYMIIVQRSDRGKATIWEYQKMKCVQTLKGHMKPINVVFSHPELPVLITGSSDGTICLWNSSTFSLLGVLNYDLGQVMAIASLKGSKRIATLHRDGMAIAQIDSWV